jgi:hypothetical protein
MSTSSKPANSPYYGTITSIDTGVFKGMSYVTNKSGSRCFVFQATGEGKRHHPVFCITDRDHTVLKFVGPKAAEARAHFTS